LAYRMRRYHGKRTSNQLGALLTTFNGKGRLIARDSRWPAVEEAPAGRIDITAALRDALESIDDLARAAFVLCDVLELRRKKRPSSSKRPRGPFVITLIRRACFSVVSSIVCDAARRQPSEMNGETANGQGHRA